MKQCTIIEFETNFVIFKDKIYFIGLTPSALKWSNFLLSACVCFAAHIRDFNSISHPIFRGKYFKPKSFSLQPRRKPKFLQASKSLEILLLFHHLSLCVPCGTHLNTQLQLFRAWDIIELLSYRSFYLIKPSRFKNKRWAFSVLIWDIIQLLPSTIFDKDM